MRLLLIYEGFFYLFNLYLMQLEELSSVIHNALWSVENTKYLDNLIEIIESKEEYCFNNDIFLNYHFPYGINYDYELLERDFVVDTLSILKNKYLVDSMVICRMLSAVKEIRETNSMNYVSNYYKFNN